jgi:hypothetical protein
MNDPLDLLAAAVRIALGSREQVAWPEHLDGDAMVSAADHHGVLVMFDRALPSLGAPERVRAATRPLVRQRTERALLLVRQLRTIVALLESHGVAVLPVKGPVLAASAYGDAAMRGASGDLDLVVSPSTFDRAVAIFAGAGYRRVEELTEEHDHGDLSMEAHLFPLSASAGTMVELHAQLRGSLQTPVMDVAAAMERSKPRPLLGAEFRMMATEDLFLYLALHAAQHLWSRMIWTADIAAMLRQPLDWNTLLDRAGAIGAQHRLAVTLRLAVDLFHADVPESVQSRLFRSPRVVRMAARARQRMRVTSTGVRVPSRLPALLTRVRNELAVRDTRAQRVAWLRENIAPNTRDRAWLTLPRGLRWLRWIIRPFRLLFRYGRSA